MNDNAEFAAPSPQESLAAAKAAFRDSFLQDDTAFSVLQERLANPTGLDAELPDFGLEPTLQRSEDGTPISDIGLRISRSTSSASGEVGLGLAVYDYLPLGRMNRAEATFKASPELTEALAAVGKGKEASIELVEAWQAGVREMSKLFTDPIVTDPMTGTFELADEIESRMHFNEEVPEK